MGLDMYAFAMKKKPEKEVDFDARLEECVEISYWRKHPNLQGWMRRLWESRGNAGDFNGDELELTWQDLDDLEAAVRNSTLPPTVGFFFGNNGDDYYREADLAFIRNARAELFSGLRVFYNSSW